MTEHKKSTRTRTGCLCCRRRHKKCDEQKPSCKFCRSKGIECQWPVKGAVFVNYGQKPKLNDVKPVGFETYTFQQNTFSVAKSITSESSLDSAPPSPNPPTILRRSSSIPSPKTDPITTYVSMSRSYDYTTSPISLPPLKSYHFVPRAGSLDVAVSTPQVKKLSVDSLLN